jgi:hypothetical protein
MIATTIEINPRPAKTATRILPTLSIIEMESTSICTWKAQIITLLIVGRYTARMRSKTPKRDL